MITERIRRDKLDHLEQWHRAESSGARKEQLEQEQNEQEQETDTASSDDFFDDSDIPNEVREPAIEISTDFQDIEGSDEVSLSIMNPTFGALNEIQGNDESFPVSGEFLNDTSAIDFLNF